MTEIPGARVKATPVGADDQVETLTKAESDALAAEWAAADTKRTAREAEETKREARKAALTQAAGEADALELATKLMLAMAEDRAGRPGDLNALLAAVKTAAEDNPKAAKATRR